MTSSMVFAEDGPLPMIFEFCAHCGIRRKRNHWPAMHHIQRCVYCARCRSKYSQGPRSSVCVLCGFDNNEDNPMCPGIAKETFFAHVNLDWRNENEMALVPVEELPDGWEQSTNAYGRVFFIDHNTGLTTFDDPRLGSTGSVSSPTTQQQSSRYTRKQCEACLAWFDNQTMYDQHCNNLDSYCGGHKVCFAWESNFEHARQHRHTRCFINSCETKYRKEEGWSDAEIEEHIWHEHTDVRRW